MKQMINQPLLPALSNYLASYESEHSAKLDQAALLAAKTVENGGLIHLASGDMCSAAVFEPFLKPGCLCAFSPVTEPTLSTLHGGYRSYLLKNTLNIGDFLYRYYRNIRPGDTFVIGDTLGSPAAAEMLRCAQEDKISVIWITSRRESSGCDADVLLPMPPPDASNGPYSSLLLSAIGYEINRRAIRILETSRCPFDTWQPYDPSSDQDNIRLCRTYRNRIKQL